jgi:phosphopentomutase
VIARPFVGEPGAFTRTHERRDFSVEPFAPTYLDRIRDAGVRVFGVGKIPDIFAERGLMESRHTESNDHGVDVTIEYLGRGNGLVVTNLVDFDTKFGHRNDAEGYARCIEAFDRRLPELIDAVDDGLLFLTGDHGCDPTDGDSTDHTREHTPILVAGGGLDARPAADLGVRETFADLGATVADLFGVPSGDGLAGTSFLAELR